MLLVISFPLLPIFASFSCSHFLRRLACLCILLICLSRFVFLGKEPGPEGSSSPLSSRSCSSRSRFSLPSSFSFFLCSVDSFPLHSFEALEGSFNPSRAKKLPPRRPSCSQTISTSRNKGMISCFIEETKAQMVLWSGFCPQASAMKTTFSRQACSILREPVSPLE